MEDKRIFLTDIRGVNKYYYFMSKRRVHFMAFYLSSCVPKPVSTSQESEIHSTEKDSVNMDAKSVQCKYKHNNYDSRYVLIKIS